MIYGIFGKTGCGKTYFMVDYLASNYFEKTEDDKGKEKYVLKKKCRIISNIDCLELEHLKFDDLVGYYYHLWVKSECAKKNIPYLKPEFLYNDDLSDRFEEAPELHELTDEARRLHDVHTPDKYDIFFAEENQLAITGRYGKIVYALDEARVFFGNHLRGDKKVFHFFAWHRHHGFDVFLIGQTRDQLHKNIRDLVLFEYRAANKIVNVLPGFRMNIYIEGMYTGFKVVRPRQEIFELYKSFDVPEMEKPKNPFIRYFIILGCIFCILFASLYYSFSYKPRMISQQKAEAAQAASLNSDSRKSSEGQIPRKSSEYRDTAAPSDVKGRSSVPEDSGLRRYYLSSSRVGAVVTLIHLYENEMYDIESFPHPVYYDRRRKKYFCKISADEYDLWRGVQGKNPDRRATAQGQDFSPAPRRGESEYQGYDL